MLGEFLGGRQSLSQECLRCVAEQMDFTNMPIDDALRLFQSKIRIQGEAQKVERLVESFSARYAVCNMDSEWGSYFQEPDAIFALAFAIMILNTDLHSENLKHVKRTRMTAEQFVTNLKGINSKDKQTSGIAGLENLDEAMLHEIYGRILTHELKTGEDASARVQQIEDSLVFCF